MLTICITVVVGPWWRAEECCFIAKYITTHYIRAHSSSVQSAEQKKVPRLAPVSSWHASHHRDTSLQPKARSGRRRWRLSTALRGGHEGAVRAAFGQSWHRFRLPEAGGSSHRRWLQRKQGRPVFSCCSFRLPAGDSECDSRGRVGSAPRHCAIKQDAIDATIPTVWSLDEQKYNPSG